MFKNLRIFVLLCVFSMGLGVGFLAAQSKDSATIAPRSVPENIVEEEHTDVPVLQEEVVDSVPIVKKVRKKKLFLGDTPFLMKQVFIAPTAKTVATSILSDSTALLKSKDTGAQTTTKNVGKEKETIGIDASLIQPFSKKKIATEVYVLLAFWVVWVILKYLFSDYYEKLAALTRQSFFTLGYKNTSIIAHFRVEGLFFRLFSICIYAYTIWIYFKESDFFRLLLDNQHLVFVKIIFLLILFYVFRFFLVRFWRDKALNQSQIIFHSTFSVGASIYLLVYDSVLTFLDKSSSWYKGLHTWLLYVIIYIFLVKAIITIKIYLKNYNKTFGFLFYLICFEFIFPLSLFWLSIQGFI